MPLARKRKIKCTLPLSNSRIHLNYTKVLNFVIHCYSKFLLQESVKKSNAINKNKKKYIIWLPIIQHLYRGNHPRSDSQNVPQVQILLRTIPRICYT